MDHYITLDDAAERLRVSPDTVRRLIADGRMIAYKFGRSLRISLSSLEAYIRSCEVHAGE
jgi:excisionase family DNA binding protein